MIKFINSFTEFCHTSHTGKHINMHIYVIHIYQKHLFIILCHENNYFYFLISCNYCSYFHVNFSADRDSNVQVSYIKQLISVKIQCILLNFHTKYQSLYPLIWLRNLHSVKQKTRKLNILNDPNIEFPAI